MIDYEIKKKFEDEFIQLPLYEKKLTELKNTLETLNKNKSKSTCKLQKTIDILQNSIYDIKNKETYHFYIAETANLLEQYKKILKTPLKMNFMGKPNKINKKKNEIVNSYLSIAKKYHLLENKPRRKEKTVNCNNCPNKKLFEVIDNSIYICITCGAQQEILLHTSTYRDLNRINMSSKYTYDRKVHFRDSIKQYQGKQNSTIEQKVYDDLENQFFLHHLLEGDVNTPKKKRFKNITKDIIHMFLKELDYTKHYENVNLIHYTITGKKPDDISHLEDRLMSDFDILTDLYDKKFKNKPEYERKNFINTQYVLYQLLVRYKHPCKKENFTMLKTVDRKSFHDNIAKVCFQELNNLTLTGSCRIRINSVTT